MCPLTDNAPLKLEVDLEYAHRFSWWFWLPEVEREQFVQAESDNDGKTLMALKRRGKRRELFQQWKTCYHAAEDDDGGECTCLNRALDSDALTSFLKKSGRSRAAVSYIAGQLHRDPGYSIKEWIRAMREPQPKPPEPEATAAEPPPPPPEPAPAATEAEPPPRRRPIPRMRRWFDGDDGNLLDRRF